ncbi:M48 family metalloprotease [Rhizobium subbaraonis]|uniref:M48 family metalloprotease n=1 Tax=Rhizobium subbaraonis TaxID=908946 RepID=UPI0015964055|nr:M48 family metalloprotease [Rhizobium subbaraonis]
MKQFVAYDATQEARDVVVSVCDSIGLPANFTIVSVRDRRVNAYATLKDSERLIVYEENFMRSIADANSKNWTGLTILAHEIGHHLCGHTLDTIGSRPPRELEADHFAGFAVSRLGGSLEQAQVVFARLSQRGSITHPPRDERLEAVKAGWNKGTVTGTEERQNIVSHVKHGDNWEPMIVEFVGKNGAWRERSPFAEYDFQERSRNGDSIFLFDSSRNIWVKLDKSKSGGFATGYWATAVSDNVVPEAWIALDPRDWR